MVLYDGYWLNSVDAMKGSKQTASAAGESITLRYECENG